MASIKTGVLPIGQSLLSTDEFIGNIFDNDGTLADDTSRVTLDLLRVFLEGSITTLNASGDIQAANFIGNGSLLTGIAGATGGISNIVNTNIIADSDGDGSGLIDFAIGSTSAMQVLNNGNITMANDLSVSGALGGTLSTVAQPNVTSLGTLTALQVDNLNIDGNIISSTSGGINIIPLSGQSLSLSGKVGFGTTTPVYQAHILGAAQKTAELTDSGSKDGILLISDTDKIGGSGGGIAFSSLNSNGTYVPHWVIKSSLGDNTANGTSALQIAGRANSGDTSLTTFLTFKPAGNIGVGTVAPAASALIDLTSTTGALLLTRMTTTQRDALTAVNGMILYNTTLSKTQIYESGAWASII